MSSPDTVRFRYSQAIWVAAVIALIGGIPLASADWYFVPVLLIPLLVAIWGFRAGTDANAEELRVRALVGQRRFPWSQVTELTTDQRGRVVARLADGQVAALPGVRRTDLPQLISVTGQRLTDESEPA